MSINRSLAYGLQESLASTYPSTDFSDFTVVVENTTFKCHKVIINACSGFFQGLFRSKMRECLENSVTIHGMTADTFDVILSSLYTGVDGVTEDNVLDVLAAAVQLQIGYLIEVCEQFVMDNLLSKDNWSVFYSHTKLHSSEKLHNCILTFMHTNFESIRHDECFLQLSADDVYKVVKSNNLTVKSEDSVVDCIVKWMQYVPQDSVASKNTEEKKANTVKLLSAVRLCLVSRVYLRALSRLEFVKCSTDAYAMIFQAMDYQSNVDIRHDAWPEAATHRAYQKYQHLMFFVNGNMLMGYELNTCEFCDPVQLSDSQNISITVFDNFLYMDSCASLKMYTQEGTWENVIINPASQCLPPQRNLLLAHGIFIYCFDVRLQALKRYDCSYGSENVWDMFKIDMIPDSIVRFQQFILMFSTKRDGVVTQCFDTTTENCVSMKQDNPMVGPTENMVSFTDQKDVYILQRNGHLWKVVSTDSSPVDFRFIAALWDFDWKIFGAVVFHKQLFIFGNADSKVPEVCVWSDPHLETINKVKIVSIRSDTQCLPLIGALSELQTLVASVETV